MAETKHGSVSAVDSTALASSAAMGGAAAGQASLTSDVSVLPATMDGDLSLSDESFGMVSPPSAMRRKASRNPGDHAGRGTSKQPMTRRSWSTGEKRLRGHRPPSPSLERTVIPNHELIAPAEDDPQARLKALEKQQHVDHALFANIIAAVRGVQTAVERCKAKQDEDEKTKGDNLTLGMKLRAEVYAIRDGLGEDIKRVTAQAIPNGVAQLMQQGVGAAIGNAIEAKFAQMETLFAQLQGHVAHFAGREGQVEEYLNAQSDKKTLEEQAVEGAFKTMDAKLSQVGEMVHRFEAQARTGTAVAAGQYNVPFTTAMRDSMHDIHAKIQQLDVMKVNYTELQNKVGNVTTGIENINGVATAQHARIEVLERIVAEHTAAIYAPPPPATAAPRAGRLDLVSSFGGNGGYAEASCQDGGYGAPPPNPWAPAGAAPPAATPPGLGASGSSPHGDPWGTLQAVTGGNNRCHCIHVNELTQKLALLEAAFHARHETRQGGTPPPDFWAAAAGQLPPRTPSAAPGRATLPLPLLGPLGAIAFKDKSLFDDKLALQEEFRFAGNQGRNPVERQGRETFYLSSANPQGAPRVGRERGHGGNL